MMARACVPVAHSDRARLWARLLAASPEEFYAHDGPINCVSIGRQSCSVFVSGGDDKIVKVWKIGRPTPIMVTNTHSRRDTQEHAATRNARASEHAGAMFEAVLIAICLLSCPVSQSLEGHTTEVDSVLFDYKETQVAAGSRGGGIKVWDLDTQQCQRNTQRTRKRAILRAKFNKLGER